jgi:hypothetical protein
MAVADIIDRILPHVPEGYSRNSGSLSILKEIERAQDRLFDYDAPCMHYIGTDNQGFPPYLLTTAGTYRYDVNSTYLSCGALTKTIGGSAQTVRCKRVVKVFVDSSNIDYNMAWIGKPYIYSAQNPYSTRLSRIEMADIKVRHFPALENTDAYVEFIEDPGTSTTKWFIDFVWAPPRLTSESIPLVVPVDYEEDILEYVIGTINKRITNKYNEFLVNFEQIVIPRFRQMMSVPPQIEENYTQMRYC